MNVLTHLYPKIPFPTVRKPYGLLMSPGGRERVHWERMVLSAFNLDRVFTWIVKLSFETSLKGFPMVFVYLDSGDSGSQFNSHH